MSNTIIIKIPSEINNFSGLNRTDKECLSQINYLNNKKEKGCFAKNKYLSDLLGVSIRQVQRIIKKLVDLGYIVRSLENWYKRTIITTFEKIKNVVERVVKEVTGKCHPPCDITSPYIYNQSNYKYNKKNFSKFGNKFGGNSNIVPGIRIEKCNLYQNEGESIEEFDLRCNQREQGGAWIVQRGYLGQKVSKNTSNGSLKDVLKMYQIKLGM